MSEHVFEKSSNIASAEHDAATSKLRVKFKNGGSYEYEGVGEDVMRNWLTAPSAGSFFHKNIRSRFKGGAT